MKKEERRKKKGKASSWCSSQFRLLFIIPVSHLSHWLDYRVSPEILHARSVSHT
jgi:hypothetical protein